MKEALSSQTPPPLPDKDTADPPPHPTTEIPESLEQPHKVHS